MAMAKVSVSFYGVRGSTPCCAPELTRVGGNTSCVVIESENIDPIILDMGTGLRYYGRSVDAHLPFRANILVSHLHWDHVQGLPFFCRIHQPDSDVSIYGPPDGDRSLADAFDGLMKPPYFPIQVRDLTGAIRFCDVETARFSLGEATVTARPVPHLGATNGYRIEVGGYTIAYVSDHQQPDDPRQVDERVLELCDGADLVIHDAQFTEGQFARKSNWGHCTANYATEVVRQAGADVLVMFHHDPENDDVRMAEIEADTRSVGLRRGLTEVMAAVEGETIKLG